MALGPRARTVLALPAAYRAAIGLLGNKRNRQWFVDEVLRVRDGEKLVDIGCGPAEILHWLPGVDYVGCDINDAYLAAARTAFGGRGVFIAGRSDDWFRDPRVHGADVVLANGSLHHIDDAELGLVLDFARRVLRPGGRFVFYEPCYLLWQSRWTAFVMSHDRGQYIRTEQEWKRVVGLTFPRMTTHVVTHVNRLGYSCLIGECHAEPAGAPPAQDPGAR